MAPPLTICKVSDEDTDYYFLSTYGVYVGDIATVTGITAENSAATPPTDFSSQPLTAVKELIKAGIIKKRKVIVKVTPAGTTTTKAYRKTLYVDAELDSDFDSDIVGKIWPIGEGAESPVVAAKNPRRVTSRR